MLVGRTITNLDRSGNAERDAASTEVVVGDICASLRYQSAGETNAGRRATFSLQAVSLPILTSFRRDGAVIG